MKYFVLSIILCLIHSYCFGQKQSAIFFEDNSYKIDLTNFHSYFKGLKLVRKEKSIIRYVSLENDLDTLNLKLNSAGKIHIVEIKSKSELLIKDFKSTMSKDYTIYDEENMKLYFNKKKSISLNFFSLGEYKIIEIYLNDRLTLD